MTSKVVAVISQLPPPVHGSTVMTQTFMAALREGGYSTAFAGRPFSAHASDVGKLSLSKVLRIPLFLARVVRACRSEGHRVVVFFVTNRPGSFLIDCAAAAVLAVLKVRRVDYVHTAGFTDLAARGSIWRMLVRWFLRGADMSVCLTQSLSEDLAPFRDGRVVVVPNTVGNHEQSFQSGTRTAPSEAPVILFMSNLLPEKGVQTFLRLADALAESWPRAQFRIAGSSNDEVLLTALDLDIAKSAAGGRIFRIGHVAGDQKWSELSAADVLVFPSSYRLEAQPLTILEAASVGTPVVAYEVGGVAETLATGIGVSVPSGDFDALVHAVERVLRDRGALGRSVVADAYARYFGFDRYREAWGEILEESWRR